MPGFGSGNLAVLDDYRDPSPVQYNESEDAITIPQAGGGVVIQFNPGKQDADNDNDDFYANIVDQVDGSALGSVSHQILDGIQADENSRSQWLADRSSGLDLLAIKIEKPKADIASAGAPMDGMSQVRHPLLLEACIKFQSNFKREMLPASGPVKVENDGQGTTAGDAQADKLGDLLNKYFLTGAPEYYPDTDRMSFDVGFSGMGFKKCFHCPIRRRPVSDTVAGKDLIVSNDATDLRTALRVTHQLSMTKPMLRRMQFVGAYRECNLNQPDMMPDNIVRQKEKEIQGVQRSYRPQDQPYTIYECYTNLDLPGFEHVDEDGNETGLPLPYKVTIERNSRQILEIRRNWEQDSETFEPRRVFIAFPFVPMFGFYATGLLHILGNATQAVTAAWRILLDGGMFSNFPGFLYALSGGRQDNLNFRVPPGGGAGVDLNGADDIRKTVMALPYKPPDPATMQLVDNIAQTAARVGGTANMIDQENVRQNMPVGTTMAIVEQQAQIIGAVHERCYIAQSHEFQQMLELFREDPKSLWRIAQPLGTWTYEELVQTLDNYALVPVADPNTPTHVHRIMKMTTLKQLSTMTPQIYDVRKVDAAILAAMKFGNPDEFFAPPPPPAAMPPDPSVIVAQTVKETKMADIQAKMQIEMGKLKDAQDARAQELQIKQLELYLEQMRVQIEAENAARDTHANMATSVNKDQTTERIAKMKVAGDIHLAHIEGFHGHAENAADKVIAHLNQIHESSRADLQREHETQQAELDRAHGLKIEAIKAKAAAAKAKSASNSKRT